MIRKTLYLCFGVIFAALTSLSACSVGAASDKEEKVDQQKEISQNELKTVWETDLADKSRFKLNIKLTEQEKAIARKFSRSVIKDLKTNDVYVHYLLTKLKEENMPLEMAAIPLVESGLNPNVHNNGAHGAWQYVRSTGSSLGLKRTAGYDGIYDFFASTDAGIKYLKRMYRDLGDWELVVMAYNQGEYGVKRAIASAKKAGLTPNSSNVRVSQNARNYLKRFKAFADILKNPQNYKVKLPNIKNRSAFRRVEVAGKVKSMNEAARLSGASIEKIKKLNSGYTTDRIDSAHGLLMPIEHADTLEEAIYGKSKKTEKDRDSRQSL